MMKQKPRDINIEALTTPKGDVPTVKGLETAINYALSDFHDDIKNLKEKLEIISSELNNQSKLISNLGSNFSELIVVLGRFDKKIEMNRLTESNNRITGEIDLLSLKEEMSQILNKIENLLSTKIE